MNSPRSLDDAIDLALARGVVYQAVAQGLRPPAEAAKEDASAAQPALRAAAALLDPAAANGDGIAPLVEALCGVSGAATSTRVAAHARLFGHSRGLVCPFETEYGAEGTFRQPQELADIAGTYAAFGLEPSQGRDERVDHAACESEFMGFLARKEAYTLGGLASAPDADAAQEGLSTLRAAARGFLRGHLGRFGRAFAARLMKEDHGGFHGALGGLLFAWLAQECRRFGLPPGPPTLEIRPPVPDEAPMACGGCDEALVRLQRPPRP